VEIEDRFALVAMIVPVFKSSHDSSPAALGVTVGPLMGNEELTESLVEPTCVPVRGGDAAREHS